MSPVVCLTCPRLSSAPDAPAAGAAAQAIVVENHGTLEVNPGFALVDVEVVTASRRRAMRSLGVAAFCVPLREPVGGYEILEPTTLPMRAIAQVERMSVRAAAGAPRVVGATLT